jgi:hypothetical protein
MKIIYFAYECKDNNETGELIGFAVQSGTEGYLESADGERIYGDSGNTPISLLMEMVEGWCEEAGACEQLVPLEEVTSSQV